MKTSLSENQEIDASYAMRPLSPYLKGGVIPVAIVLTGLLIAKLFIWFRVEPPRQVKDTKPIPVDVVSVAPAAHPVLIHGYGTVEASRMLQLRPQVSGYVVKVHAAFEKGGQLQEGEELFAIDQRDYEIALENAKAAVARAEFELEVEQGNTVVAAREWKLLKKSMPESALSGDLALRKPHLKQKKAALSAAKSQLLKAQIDLERTKFLAPFDLLVLKEMVEVGQFVSSQSVVAELAATDSFYASIKISQNSLQWLPQDSLSQVKVSISSSRNSAEGSWSRPARLVRVLGDVEQSGRMAQLLVAIDNPLDVVGNAPGVLLGTYVKAELQGVDLQNVLKVPRAAVQEGDYLWTVDKDNTLFRKKVTRVHGQKQSAFVQGDFSGEEKVIVSPLRNALEGAPVVTKQELAKQAQDAANE